MNKLLKLSLITVAVLSGSAVSAEEITTKGGFGIKSDDGKYSFKFNGRIQLDVTAYDSDPIDLNNGTEMRRGRFAASGKIEDWGYKLQYDFAKTSSPIKDAFVSYNGFKNTKIIFGNQKEAFGMEEQTSSKYITFMERSMVTEAFGLGRGMGISAHQWGENWTLNYGVFGKDVNQNIIGDEQLGLNGRFNYAVVNTKDSLVSFGISLSTRKTSKGSTIGSVTIPGEIVRFRTRPESHQALIRIASTGKIKAERYDMVGLETAMKFGSLTVLGEYTTVNVNAIDGGIDSSFDGYTLSASYLFGGNTRPYTTKQGIFKKVKPGKNGAWEVAARFSSVDLNDNKAGIEGGQVDSITLGANYYINTYMRAMFNVVSANGDDFVRYDTNSAAARLQVIW
jgi:phosphate-selective porin OprO/OprP